MSFKTSAGIQAARVQDYITVNRKTFNFQTCEKIDLSRQSLNDSDIESLCAKLGRFKMLQAIDLRDNKLSDLGGRLIAEGLKSNCSVTELHLQGVDFDSYNFQHLSSDSSNNIGEAVLQEITSLVQRNCDEPDQRYAEVAAIHEVILLICMMIILLLVFAAMM